jgi:hypothetical protein
VDKKRINILIKQLIVIEWKTKKKNPKSWEK